MSTAAHTPGPWRVDPEQDIDIQSADGNTEIAVALSRSLERVTFTFSGKMPSKQATIANARLIAAAPEMLAVLNAARIMLKNRDQRPEEMKLLDAIKSVTAKAEGTA